ncbi:hypothetical protein BsWGS_26351 [Bradybaena similaris]
MYGDRTGQAPPSSTIDQYHHRRRPHYLHRLQGHSNYLQLQLQLSSVFKKPVRHETVLKTIISGPTANLVITTPRLNIPVTIKGVLIVFTIIFTTLASGKEMVFQRNHIKFVRPSAKARSVPQSSSSHNVNPRSYQPSSELTSTYSSSPSSPSLSSQVVIPRSSSLHSDYRTLANSAQMDQQDTRARSLSLLISSLEDLHILNKTKMACFRLDKITITNNEFSSSAFSPTSPSPTPEENTVGVYLYFRELSLTKTSLASSMEQPKPSSQHSTSPKQHLLKSNQNMMLIHDSCVSDPVTEVHKLAVNNYKQEGGSQSGGQRHTDNHTPLSHGFSTAPSAGLSRTQIVVVSTCSCIIGMFFLIAAFLRLRNCIKRSRLEQELERRPKFRSCSVALRGAAQSLEQLRRDSVTSKASHQNSLLTPGSNITSSWQRDTSAPSLRLQLDQAPLLLNSRSVQALDASALADSYSSLKYIDEMPLTPKKKDIPMTFLMKHNNHMMKYNPKEVCLVHQAEISLDGSILIATDAGSAINSANIPKTSNNNVRFSRCRVDGQLKPVLSTGSFKGRVLEGAVVPPAVARLKTMPRLGWVGVAGDRSPETILGMFTKSGSTGQIGAHGDSNSDRRRDADFGLSVVDAEVGLAGDRSKGPHVKTNIGDGLKDESSPPPASLEYNPEDGLGSDGSNGVHIETNIGDGLKGESSPPQVPLECNPEEAVRVDLDNQHMELQITEQDTQDLAAPGSLVDQVSTNVETSSSGIPASTESDTSVACDTDQNHDVLHIANNSGQSKSLELLASSTVGIPSDSFIDTN